MIVRTSSSCIAWPMHDVSGSSIRSWKHASTGSTPRCSAIAATLRPLHDGSALALDHDAVPSDPVDRRLERVALTSLDGVDQSRSSRGVGEQVGQLADRRPLRKQRPEHRGPRRVRVLVARHVVANRGRGRAGRRLAPTRTRSRTSGGSRAHAPRRAARPRSLRPPPRNRCAPSPRMCDAYRPPGSRRFLGERHHFVGVAVHPRRVDQAGREPDGAGVHRLRDRSSHRSELIRRRRAPLHAHREMSRRPVADQRGDVHGWARRVQPCQESAERAEPEIHRVRGASHPRCECGRFATAGTATCRSCPPRPWSRLV